MVWILEAFEGLCPSLRHSWEPRHLLSSFFATWLPGNWQASCAIHRLYWISCQYGLSYIHYKSNGSIPIIESNPYSILREWMLRPTAKPEVRHNENRKYVHILLYGNQEAGHSWNSVFHCFVLEYLVNFLSLVTWELLRAWEPKGAGWCCLWWGILKKGAKSWETNWLKESGRPHISGPDKR